jgi:hypothetical protein
MSDELQVAADLLEAHGLDSVAAMLREPPVGTFYALRTQMNQASIHYREIKGKAWYANHGLSASVTDARLYTTLRTACRMCTIVSDDYRTTFEVVEIRVGSIAVVDDAKRIRIRRKKR